MAEKRQARGEAYELIMAKAHIARVEALYSGNYGLYAILCDKTGVTPESIGTYDLGKQLLAERANRTTSPSQIMCFPNAR